MKLEHVALYVRDLENMRRFYEKHFQATAGERYHNPRTGFTSYFLNFEDGARLEIINLEESNVLTPSDAPIGYAHISISLGSKEAVDALTEEFRNEGIKVVGEPRTTGDGYYESVILDPEGNRIELTV